MTTVGAHGNARLVSRVRGPSNAGIRSASALRIDDLKSVHFLDVNRRAPRRVGLRDEGRTQTFSSSPTPGCFSRPRRSLKRRFAIGVVGWGGIDAVE